MSSSSHWCLALPRCFPALSSRPFQGHLSQMGPSPGCPVFALLWWMLEGGEIAIKSVCEWWELLYFATGPEGETVHGHLLHPWDDPLGCGKWFLHHQRHWLRSGPPLQRRLRKYSHLDCGMCESFYGLCELEWKPPRIVATLAVVCAGAISIQNLLSFDTKCKTQRTSAFSLNNNTCLVKPYWSESTVYRTQDAHEVKGRKIILSVHRSFFPVATQYSLSSLCINMGWGLIRPIFISIVVSQDVVLDSISPKWINPSHIWKYFILFMGQHWRNNHTLLQCKVVILPCRWTALSK